MTHAPSRVRLHTFPASDETLVRDARAALEAQDDSLDEAELRDAVERALRRSYGAACVVVQHDLARLDAAQVTWYVYRDGRVLTPPEVAGDH